MCYTMVNATWAETARETVGNVKTPPCPTPITITIDRAHCRNYCTNSAWAERDGDSNSYSDGDGGGDGAGGGNGKDSDN